MLKFPTDPDQIASIVTPIGHITSGRRLFFTVSLPCQVSADLRSDLMAPRSFSSRVIFSITGTCSWPKISLLLGLGHCG